MAGCKLAGSEFKWRSGLYWGVGEQATRCTEGTSDRRADWQSYIEQGSMRLMQLQKPEVKNNRKTLRKLPARLAILKYVNPNPKMRLQPVPLTDRGPACQAIVFITRPQISDFFFDKFLEYFFAEPDAAFFKSLGLNCVRIAVNYRHFEDDDNPRVLKTDGFRHLDRAIEACAKHQMYTIIDMHTGQNGGWHCDAGVHIAGFWIHKDFQDRLVWLWEEIARHYKDNPWVAGYNLMNEPEDSHSTGLVHFYDRVYEAIRTIDENHILFLDGNTYFIDFFPDDAKERWKNAAFTMQAECLNHPQNETECSLQCAVYGFPASPAPHDRSPE
ncbi:glycoside hydrolase family 5 protein [Paxillus involutus ATCC 200175]|nr:glycoside hydrolase family 5 protein [Paxillus involutus ATCC 200175]